MESQPMTATEEEWEAEKSRIKKNYFGAKTVERLLGMTALDRSHRLTERLARKTQDGTLGEQDEASVGEGDDMGIQVGDNVINHHYHAPSEERASPEKDAPSEERASPGKDAPSEERASPGADEAVQTDAPPEAGPSIVKRAAPRLVKAGIAAALLASGGGVGVAVPWLAGAFLSPPAAVQQGTDTTRRVGVDVDKYIPGGAPVQQSGDLR